MRRNRLIESLQSIGMGVLLAAAPAMSLLQAPPAIESSVQPLRRGRAGKSGAAAIQRAAAKAKRKARHAR